MQEWIELLSNTGTTVFVIAYFCYMNYKYNQTILESLTCIKTMLQEFKEERKED